MPTIFCSNKLSTILKINKIQHVIHDKTDAWNGHLFYLLKRKCLIFIHKQTLYSFVMLDILKKNLADFNMVFVENYIMQLQADSILPSTYENQIRERYKNIMLLPTDNDRKVIGSINDCVFRIKYYGTHRVETLRDANQYIGQHLNETPMGAVGYKHPKDLMREKINQEYHHKDHGR